MLRTDGYWGSGLNALLPLRRRVCFARFRRENVDAQTSRSPRVSLRRRAQPVPAGDLFPADAVPV